MIGWKKEKAYQILMLSPEKIRPNPSQPRVDFDVAQIELLARSIQENGLLQPLTVRQGENGEYVLIAGERRLRACLLLGLSEVACVILPKTERESAILALIENLHREGLNCFEQAQAIKNLMAQWNVTQEEAAKRLGIAQSTLANQLRILRLTPTQQSLMVQHHLTARHARALLQLSTEEQRDQVLQMVIEKQWNVAQTEEYIAKFLKPKQKQIKIPIIKDVRIFLNTMNKAVSIMKQAGIAAMSEQTQQEDYIEYIVRIPTSRNTTVSRCSGRTELLK